MIGPHRPPLAVALRYGEADDAPVVVASGRGVFGQRIIDLAREHGVPLEEDPALAQALSTVELDAEIPEELFKAVAEVLGFILSAAKRANRISPPALEAAPPVGI